MQLILTILLKASLILPNNLQHVIMHKDCLFNILNYKFEKETANKIKLKKGTNSNVPSLNVVI